MRIISQGFEGHGQFEGRIASFDGDHYHVHYPADGDEEELSENEFDGMEITHRPVASADDDVAVGCA